MTERKSVRTIEYSILSVVAVFCLSIGNAWAINCASGAHENDFAVICSPDPVGDSNDGPADVGGGPAAAEPAEPAEPGGEEPGGEEPGGEEGEGPADLT